jgi:8-oxo-dGTP pyrophosphatase MutT (NUDIX family)
MEHGPERRSIIVDGSDPFIRRIAGRLLPGPARVGADAELIPDWRPDVPFDRPPVEAAVLIGLIRRPNGLGVLYTERAADLRSHSGQIAFPGGKIDAGDADAADAALREAAEEVDLDRADAEILGFMPPYFTGSNYLITPVVALVEPHGPFVPNPGEVKSVFEVPLDWLADSRNYGTYRIHRGGTEHTTWQIVHGGLLIWGITANLTRRFHDMALAGEVAP